MVSASGERMVKVLFLPEQVMVEVPVGSSLLTAAQGGSVPIVSACGGVGACASCHVHVQNGGGFLSEVSEQEEDILDKAVGVAITSRLACQARVVREMKKERGEQHTDADVHVVVPR